MSAQQVKVRVEVGYGKTKITFTSDKHIVELTYNDSLIECKYQQQQCDEVIKHKDPIYILSLFNSLAIYYNDEVNNKQIPLVTVSRTSIEVLDWSYFTSYTLHAKLSVRIAHAESDKPAVYAIASSIAKLLRGEISVETAVELIYNNIAKYLTGFIESAKESL